MKLKSFALWLPRIGLLVIALVMVSLVLSNGSLPAGNQSAASDRQATAIPPTSTPQRLTTTPRSETLVLLGGQSNNPRAYDPATGGGDHLVFSGLVTFDAHLKVSPDLADSWTISPDGTVYTFHIRSNARFHDGRPVTAQDVIYSWERAADPATDSNTVLTYMSDIVGLADRRAGKAKQISGLKALDDHTLQVTIDAPKPYFLMKLTYEVADVLDKNNVESGPDWYRRPNGTGPYKLLPGGTSTQLIYERNDDFYLTPPPIHYIVYKLYSGIGTSLYETGQIDITGVSAINVARFLDPGEPLHKELYQSVNMCTSYVLFDVHQPPFDDPKVRQAFALATDKAHYISLGLAGVGLPTKGLYPPALPGYNTALNGLDYNPTLARQRLAESRYGSPGKLPTITITRGGYSSYVSLSTNVLIDMWQKTLGVSIQVENLEPDKYLDQVDAGHHGQLLLTGWCADYPDPENFADALFHTGAEQNNGHYSNPAVDSLLDQGRVERDVTKRIQLYQQAEQLLVNDAAAIFLNNSESYVLVKPYIKGYSLTPNYPLFRSLSIDTTQASP